ncbi:MAG TPA: FCD domain-containing protein [Solirubrobacteraceae bacterium]|nr:FCD domain-containing protein [Solirubrobacteraceae bacterium]
MEGSPSPAVAAVFEPVQTATTFEETVERLGTAIRLGLLGPGARLPPERDLADQLGIARSTLRQALTSLTESGHLVALRGRGGGTFVAEVPPIAESTRVELTEGHWRELLDYRVAFEVGAVVLAAERIDEAGLARLREQVEIMRTPAPFATYRRADVFFHLGVAEATGSPRLVAAMTELQGQMSELIAHIAHPVPVLEKSNAQHAQLIVLLERRDAYTAAQLVREHMLGTEKVLAGLLR